MERWCSAGGEETLTEEDMLLPKITLEWPAGSWLEAGM